MLDALKNYLNLASGVTEVTRQRAIAAAKALQASGEATAEQVQNIADELLVNSRNNRDALLALVRYEVDRAINRLGLATADEMASLQRRVTSLEGALAKSPDEGAAKASKATKSAARSTAAKAAPAKSTAAKAPAPKATGTAAATRAAATRTVAKAPAKSTATKATPAKTTAANSTAAKATSAARKAPTKKSGGAGPATS